MREATEEEEEGREGIWSESSKEDTKVREGGKGEGAKA